MSIRLPLIENKTFFYSQRQRRRRHRRRKTEEELRAIFGDRTSIRFQFAPNSTNNRTARTVSALSRPDRPVSAVSSSSGRTRALSQSDEKASSSGRAPPKKSLASLHKLSTSQPASVAAAAIAEELDLSLSETNLLLQAEQDTDDTRQATFTFQEAKFAATGILSQLSVYLARKLPPGEEFLSLTLIRSLQLGFTDLSRHVVVPSKKWQTDYYLDYETGRPFRKQPRSILKQLRSMKQQGGASSKKSSRRTSFLDVKSDLSTTGSEGSDNEDTTPVSGLAILEYRRESKQPSFHFGTPKTRAEKHSYITKPTDTVKKRPPPREVPVKVEPTADGTPAEAESLNFQPGGGVLTFSLNPDTCSDDSWIVYPSSEEDPERHTLLELAKERLRAAIKSKRDLQIQAQQRQADGPLELQYYGERHMPAKLRCKKITLPRVTLSSSFVVTLQQEEDAGTDENEGFKRKKMILSLPDGSCTWFYPSGRIALQVSRGSYSHRSPYVTLFPDLEQAPMLASFTPDGKGCCYHENGYLSLLFNQEGGTLMDKRGWIERKWAWPPSNMKLSTSITLQLSYNFSLRCLSQGNVTLHFKCNGEQLSLGVGYLLPEQNEEETSSSLPQATSSLIGAQHVRRRSKKRNKRLLDDSIDKFDIDLSIAEFQEYKDRIRNLVNDWLEFYRLALRINTPSPTPRSPSPEFGRYKRSIPRIWDFSTPPPNIPVGGTSRQSSRPQSRVSALPPTLYGMAISSEGAVEHSRMHSPEQFAISMGAGDPIFAGNREGEAAKSTSHRLLWRPVLPSVERNACTSTLRLSISTRSVMENSCSCERKQKRRIPEITDLEFDTFIKLHLPPAQLCVVCIYSSKIPNSLVSEVMLNTLHYHRNKYRAAPCLDSDLDLYRLFKYDLATAAAAADRSIPLLVERHKAEPGMFFMYWGGRLVFADFVFNGYGNAQKDFSKQVRVTLRLAKSGQHLPDNFKFSSIPKRSFPSLAFSLLGPSSGHVGPNQLVRHSDSGVTLHSLLSFRDRPAAKLGPLV